MALTVRQLTADGTFLLSFAAPFAPSAYKGKFPGSFNVLLDPWLQGQTTILHPKFAYTDHTVPPAVNSLADIQDHIDLIVISQGKEDHLHKDTLCSLPKDSKIRILASPKAAKRIREWKHFKYPHLIQSLFAYNPKKGDAIVRIPIDPYSSASADGEITLANIEQKGDIASLHNAIAITYCPPGTLLTSPDGSTVKLDDMPMMSSSRPSTARSPTSPSSGKSSRSRYLKGSLDDVEWIKPGSPQAPEDVYDATKPKPVRPRNDLLLRRPSTRGSRSPAITSIAKRQDNFEKVLSVIYSPHGIDSKSLRTYVANHLSLLESALPITTLFHSLTLEANPWWMGGVVCAGAPNGMKIVREFGVKYWIGAHDEIKEGDGLATKWIKTRRYDVQEVTKMLREADGIGGGSGIGTEVIALGSGDTRRLAG